MNPEQCSFYLTNGVHCVINERCVVCKVEAAPQLTKGEKIELKNFGPIDGTYKIAEFKNGTLRLEFLNE